MPTQRTLLGAAAFSLALAGGGVAGALLGTPNLSGAQDDAQGDTPAVEATVTERAPHGGEGLATAAEALGLTEEELRAALAEGQSIAQVAEAEGVDVQIVIDALVAQATEHLEEAIDDLPERMEALVNREGLPDRGRGGPGGGHHGPRGPMDEGLDAAAEAIGISVDELREAVRAGASLAEVAEANDVDPQAVIDALVAEATERIDAAVADDRLSADRAEAMQAELAERITARVNGDHPDRHGDPTGPDTSDA